MIVFFGILIILIALIAVSLVRANRKSEYAKTIYHELEKTPDGQQLRHIIQEHSDKQFRRDVMAMQLKVLEKGYRAATEPAHTAAEMVNTLNAMLKAYDQP